MSPYIYLALYVRLPYPILILYFITGTEISANRVRANNGANRNIEISIRKLDKEGTPGLLIPAPSIAISPMAL